MNNTPPTDYSAIIYFWVLLLGAWGGIVNNIRKVRSHELKRFSFWELLGDLLISGFLALIAFWICEAHDVPQLVTAPIVGITAHMGTRSLVLLERMIARYLKVEKEYEDAKEDDQGRR